VAKTERLVMEAAHQLQGAIQQKSHGLDTARGSRNPPEPWPSGSGSTGNLSRTKNGELSGVSGDRVGTQPDDHPGKKVDRWYCLAPTKGNRIA